MKSSFSSVNNENLIEPLAWKMMGYKNFGGRIAPLFLGCIVTNTSVRQLFYYIKQLKIDANDIKLLRSHIIEHREI